MHHRRYAYELLARRRPGPSEWMPPDATFDCRQPPFQLVAASRQEAQKLPHVRRHAVPEALQRLQHTIYIMLNTSLFMLRT
jgi:hypothetical protein